jgi:proteasome lid subunit RPN8/RPN11
MEPRSLVSAMNRIEDLGLDLLAAFHSHPRGPAGVSSMDQAEWFYPESILMVLTRAGGAWSGRAFRLEGDRFREVRIAFQPD